MKTVRHHPVNCTCELKAQVLLLLQVCRRWQQVAGTNMAALRPAKPKLHLLAGLMPGLTSLDLSGDYSVVHSGTWHDTTPRWHCCCRCM